MYKRQVQKLVERGFGGQANFGDTAAINPAQRVINDSCLRCHDGVDLERANLSDLSSMDDAQKLTIFRQVAGDAMPKNSEPLSDDDKNVLLQFLLNTSQ